MVLLKGAAGSFSLKVTPPATPKTSCMCANWPCSCTVLFCAPPAPSTALVAAVGTDTFSSPTGSVLIVMFTIAVGSMDTTTRLSGVNDTVEAAGPKKPDCAVEGSGGIATSTKHSPV